jgi:addiction module RelE/StbE family toxin
VTRIRWTEQAVNDIRAIRQYIERDSPRYGRLVAERLFEATDRLRDFPRSGRIVPELGRDDVREIIMGEYRIVYQVEPRAVTLLTVFRSSRLFPTSVPGLE